ncbi:unnamed protein product, partial [Prorocentrum cordatum]
PRRGAGRRAAAAGLRLAGGGGLARPDRPRRRGPRPRGSSGVGRPGRIGVRRREAAAPAELRRRGQPGPAVAARGGRGARARARGLPAPPPGGRAGRASRAGPQRRVRHRGRPAEEHHHSSLPFLQRVRLLPLRRARHSRPAGRAGGRVRRRGPDLRRREGPGRPPGHVRAGRPIRRLEGGPRGQVRRLGGPGSGLHAGVWSGRGRPRGRAASCAPASDGPGSGSSAVAGRGQECLQPGGGPRRLLLRGQRLLLRGPDRAAAGGEHVLPGGAQEERDRHEGCGHQAGRPQALSRPPVWSQAAPPGAAGIRRPVRQPHWRGGQRHAAGERGGAPRPHQPRGRGRLGGRALWPLAGALSGRPVVDARGYHGAPEAAAEARGGQLRAGRGGRLQLQGGRGAAAGGLRRARALERVPVDPGHPQPGEVRLLLGVLRRHRARRPLLRGLARERRHGVRAPPPEQLGPLPAVHDRLRRRGRGLRGRAPGRRLGVPAHDRRVPGAVRPVRLLPERDRCALRDGQGERHGHGVGVLWQGPLRRAVRRRAPAAHLPCLVGVCGERAGRRSVHADGHPAARADPGRVLRLLGLDELQERHVLPDGERLRAHGGARRPDHRLGHRRPLDALLARGELLRRGLGPGRPLPHPPRQQRVRHRDHARRGPARAAGALGGRGPRGRGRRRGGA